MRKKGRPKYLPAVLDVIIAHNFINYIHILCQNMKIFMYINKYAIYQKNLQSCFTSYCVFFFNVVQKLIKLKLELNKEINKHEEDEKTLFVYA